jgi:hypothetical protein
MRVQAGGDGATTVREGGPRRLTESLAEAPELWTRLGGPGMDSPRVDRAPGRQAVRMARQPPGSGQVRELRAPPDP